MPTRIYKYMSFHPYSTQCIYYLYISIFLCYRSQLYILIYIYICLVSISLSLSLFSLKDAAVVAVCPPMNCWPLSPTDRRRAQGRHAEKTIVREKKKNGALALRKRFDLQLLKMLRKFTAGHRRKPAHRPPSDSHAPTRPTPLGRWCSAAPSSRARCRTDKLDASPRISAAQPSSAWRCNIVAYFSVLGFTALTALLACFFSFSPPFCTAAGFFLAGPAPWWDAGGFFLAGPAPLSDAAGFRKTADAPFCAAAGFLITCPSDFSPCLCSSCACNCARSVSKPSSDISAGACCGTSCSNSAGACVAGAASGRASGALPAGSVAALACAAGVKPPCAARAGSADACAGAGGKAAEDAVPSAASEGKWRRAALRTNAWVTSSDGACRSPSLYLLQPNCQDSPQNLYPHK